MARVTAAQHSVSAPGSRTGARLGSLVLGPLLGRGAMGEVYRAEDVVRGTAVAVKLLLGDLARDAKTAARFRREADAAMALHHEGVVEVLRSGETDDGVPYLVMELLPAATLA